MLSIQPMCMKNLYFAVHSYVYLGQCSCCCPSCHCQPCCCQRRHRVIALPLPLPLTPKRASHNSLSKVKTSSHMARSQPICSEQKKGGLTTLSNKSTARRRVMAFPTSRIREYHGLANPHGSRVWVVTGAGAGCKIPTHDQPSPAAQVTQTRCGLSFSPPKWVRVSYYGHLRSV